MKDKFNKKYIIITKDLQKNLIEFLDEIQFDIAGEDDKDSMHKVNFISWAINELLNSYEAFFPKDSKKKRDDYVEETFMDWNLPEMSDEEYEKLVDQFDDFLRAWEKNYLKDNPKKKPKQKRKSKPKSDEDFIPPFEDVAEYMSLEEIKEYLLEDDELTDGERFDLYYEEHRRVKNKGLSYDELLQKSGIKPAGWKPKKK
tara:strand:+ start:509 stop:1108 length:600 start_codon:yes stop_codon:yes gene_type:complete